MVVLTGWVLYAVAAVLVAALAGLGGATYIFYRRYEDERERTLDSIIDDDGAIEFESPDVKRSPLDYLRVMRHYQKAQKLANKGYVKWYRLGSRIDRPLWVKPKQDGTGVPKIEKDGKPYYFPKSSMVSDAMTGAYVAMHRTGEANPINLRDPAYPGIPTDLIERVINLETENTPSGGLLGDMDLDTTTLMWLGMAVLFVVYAIYYYVQNGGF